MAGNDRSKLGGILAGAAVALAFFTPAAQAAGVVDEGWWHRVRESGVIDDERVDHPPRVDAVATSPTWIGSGDENNARFGCSVATAGDVDGDGYSDVIVGAFFHDAGAGAGADRGRAYLYLGSAGGLASSPAWTGSGDENGARLGWSVATAGDVNGDGYADVIVGAYTHDAGAGAAADRGRAYVYLGSSSGLSASPAWTASGDDNGGAFGNSVATAGDVNGDGYSDVLVGAYTHDGGAGAGADRGRAYLYLGSAAGLATSPAWTATGDENNALVGGSVATAGDVNGDGYADVIVGAYAHDAGAGAGANRGRAYVYLGSAAGLATSPVWVGSGDENGGFYGWTVAGAGDVDGDGYADIVVGAEQHDGGGGAGANRGRAYVYMGSAAGPAPSPEWTHSGDENLALFGESVATAGDVNGDGYADVVVGAKGHDAGAGAGADRGRVYVFLGAGSGLAKTPAWFVSGDENSATLGATVATAGDVNGDGFSDVSAGAPVHDAGAGAAANRGRAYVHLGSGSGPAAVPAWIGSGDEDIALYGKSVASAGDVNGDGYSDAIVGAYGHDAGGPLNSNPGRAYLYMGGPGGMPSVAAWTGSGSENYAGYGGSVASAGDVNGDGYADVVVAAIYHDAGAGSGADRGRVYLYFGSASGLATVPSWFVSGDENKAYFGFPVAGAGDVNGDGYADIIVGAPGHDAGGGTDAERGRAYVYLGSALGPSAAPAWVASGDENYARFGASVASAGDVNGDGYSDVIVGAYTHGGGGTYRGRAYVYLGSPGGLAASPVWVVTGDEDQAFLGFSVAGAGDVNGDGDSDVIVGAYGHDGGGGLGANLGRVYVYLGTSSGVAMFPAATLTGDGGNFGYCVATAGDVNGDGYSDVIVGAYAHPAGGTSTSIRGRAYVFPGSPSGVLPGAVWFGSGDEDNAYYGWFVASAGDVDGDGFADVLVSAMGHDAYAGTDADRGMAYVYQGNGEGRIGGGVSRIPQQMRHDGAAPIGLLGKSDSASSFRVRTLGRTAAGRGDIRLVWEAKPPGTAFDATGAGVSSPQDTGAPGSTGSVASFDAAIADLDEGTFYRWRLRTVSGNPFFPGTPWVSLAGGNVTETKFRTAGCIDHDGDGYGALGDVACLTPSLDCNDGDATIWGAPGETRNLRFTTKLFLAWNPPLDPGGLTSALVYDTVRSMAASDFVTTATCIETGDGPNTVATDLDPSPGQAFFYLGRAKNACPQGVGTFGQDGQGATRVVRTCP